jgi:hypothetical protein
MNDLERDLKELFETKSGDVMTTPLAPKAVLKRGRRRQVGTVIGGTLMAVAAAAVVIGGGSAFLTDRADTPPMGADEVLPARTATIGGVTVTAPEGWSLLDQWPLGMNVTTETCTSTFEGQGTPVGEGGGGGLDDPVETPPIEECNSVDLPGGVPLFTLSNVEPNPAQAMCEIVPGFPAQTVAPTGVFLYVAVDANADGTSPTWPQPLGEGSTDPCAEGSIVRWSVDGVSYLAAAAFGEEASSEDRDTAAAAFDGLSFEGLPVPTTSPVVGFVMAAGIEDGVAWRLEAGPNLRCAAGDAACGVQLAAVSDDDAATPGSASVAPPTGSPFSATTLPLGTSTVVFGGMGTQVASIEVTTTGGATVTPTTAPWPTALEAFAAPDAPVDGRIWWTVVPGLESVRAILEDGTEVTVGDRQGSGTTGPVPEIDELRLDTTREGDEVVATGEDLSTTWEARTGTGRIEFEAAGIEPLSFSTSIAGGTMVDAPGGSFFLWLDEPSAGPVTILVDGTGESLVGRWMPAIDALGKDARLWIVTLPGSGSGLRWTSPDDHLPLAESWPESREPGPGVVASAGINGGDGISWKLAYTDAECLVLAQVAGDGSIGQTGCLDPSGSQTPVSHAPGDARTLIAVVVQDGEANGIFSASDGVVTRYGQCTTPAGDPAWEGRAVCMIEIPNDVEVPLRITAWDPDARDDVVIDRWVVRVSEGQLFAEPE